MNRPKRATFPLIRHFSAQLTPWLARLPISANQVTLVSLLIGLAGCYLMMQGTYQLTLWGAVLFFISYILDHCDGELARLNNQQSEFGAQFDSFVDWILHAALFGALGWAAAAERNERIWVWLGIAAGTGATINYALSVVQRVQQLRIAADKPADEAETGDPEHPENWKEFLIFAFRELTRADFCFILLALAIADLAWVLVPAAAIGAQAYWISLLFAWRKKYRV